MFWLVALFLESRGCAWTGGVMGYGLRVNVAALVNRDRRFDVVIDHYRAFNLETGPASGMDLMVYPAVQSRFSTFLELIQNLSSIDAETALVVNHGKSDANDSPLGLLLPLTAQAPQWAPDEYTLNILSNFIGRIPDDDECTDAERKSILEGVSMPAGTLKPLATALQNLRVKRRLRRLELRACNLGGNQQVMQLLGMVLGLQTVVAPKVHMFYLRLGTAFPDTPAGFARWRTQHPRARIFDESTGLRWSTGIEIFRGGSWQRVPVTPPRVIGIQVNGTHGFRTMDFNTTDLDVKWFIEKFVCPGSGYIPRTPGRRAPVAPFSFSGMEVGNSFVLAQEDAYEAQLVEETIPRVPISVSFGRTGT